MDLKDRMKKYEDISKTNLIDSLPICVRVDMKNARSVTKYLYKPFDSVFMKAMETTAFNMVHDIQCAKVAYVSSDEISIIIYKGNSEENYNTQVFYDGKVQKICSLTASLATLYFNRYLNELVTKSNHLGTTDIAYTEEDIDENKTVSLEEYEKLLSSLIVFDSRCYNLPVDEVNNYMIYRQRDCERNSIYSLARSLYSHKSLQGLNGKQLQDKMFTEKGVNWNELTVPEKRGIIIYKGKTVEDRGWNIDRNIPIFHKEPNYINKFL